LFVHCAHAYGCGPRHMEPRRLRCLCNSRPRPCMTKTTTTNKSLRQQPRTGFATFVSSRFPSNLASLPLAPFSSSPHTFAFSLFSLDRTAFLFHAHTQPRLRCGTDLLASDLAGLLYRLLRHLVFSRWWLFQLSKATCERFAIFALSAAVVDSLSRPLGHFCLSVARRTTPAPPPRPAPPRPATPPLAI
jgi:hypothetical protein